MVDHAEHNDLKGIHAEAREAFDDVVSAVKDEREQNLEDRRFYSIAGAQWEGKLGEQFENKPKFEVNKVHLGVMRIINEYRNNRITVDFISRDGDQNYQLADLCDGLYRADEQHSVADEAYDNAFEEAVGGGMGAWRLHTCYEDEEDPDSDYQRINISPIFDADTSVFFNLAAKRQDKSDATMCWVISSIPRKQYMDEYVDDPASWPKEVESTEFDWLTVDVVYIAEYYKVEYVKEKVLVWRELSGEEKRYKESEFTPALRERLVATGAEHIRTKPLKIRKVHKYIMNGNRIIEDCGYIAGKNIPIVPVYGKRWFVDNIERCMGHVRLAKDPQRLKNMQVSKLGEISALSTVEKPILTPEQIAGHQHMWEDDNIKNYAYLLINPVTDATGQEIANPPVGYTKVPNIPPAMAALLQLTEQDIQEILGSQQEGDKMVSNMSGKVVEMIQERLDMQSYIYMSNFAKAMKRSGEIWLSMAKDVYVEQGRKMKTVNPEGETGSITLGEPSIDKDSAKKMINDLSNANFDLIVDVGPSSVSKRAATVRALTGLLALTTDPETRAILEAYSLMNIEAEGGADIRKYYRKKLLRMGVVQPSKQEREEMLREMQAQEEDPQSTYLKALAERELSEAVKNQAEIISEQADADKTRAETAKIVTEIDKVQQEQAMEVIEKFTPRVTPPDVTGSKITE